MRAGLELPEKIQNAPSLLPGLELYYIAFLDLVSSRNSGMSIGRIWWNTIQDYCERVGLDRDQTEAMHYHITSLDEKYIEKMSKKSK